MLEIVFWLFFGLLSGWIASLLSESHVQPGAGLSISAGIVGAIIGGIIIFRLVPTADEFNDNSLLGAITGAVLVILVTKLIKRRN